MMIVFGFDGSMWSRATPRPEYGLHVLHGARTMASWTVSVTSLLLVHIESGMDSELKRRITECLNEALEADDPDEMWYHIRQALQLLNTETTTQD